MYNKRSTVYILPPRRCTVKKDEGEKTPGLSSIPSCRRQPFLAFSRHKEYVGTEDVCVYHVATVQSERYKRREITEEEEGKRPAKHIHRSGSNPAQLGN